MNKKEFYSIYIPALEEALRQDDKNYGYFVKGPEEFVDKVNAINLDSYLAENEDLFTEMVAYYFDAKSHNFQSIDGISISEYRAKIEEKILLIRNELSLL